MKKFILTFLLIPLLSFSSEIRKPSVAGSFYPSNPEVLSSMIDKFLKKANVKKFPQKKIIGIVAPHAGYIYSGETAAYSFKIIKGMKFSTVIIIGKSHHASFKGAIIDDRKYWLTPLGKIEIDQKLFKTLYRNKNFRTNKTLLDVEHCIEVEVPFLQKVLRNFKIFPVLLGDSSDANTSEIAEKLWSALKGRKDILIVVSTDLSHYFPLDIAEKKDALLFKTIQTKNLKLLYKRLEKRVVEMCGDAAVITLMKISSKYGDYEVKVLHYSTSANVSGDKSRVVGYGAMVFLKKEWSKGRRKMLTEKQKKELLKIAKETLEYYLSGKKLPELKIDDPVLKEKRGVFVTLKKHGNLRGCIGYIQPIKPLAEAVREMAIQSATQDPRFPPVKYEELKDIEIEISVLTVPKRVKSPDEIVLGRDGVIVKRGFRQGVFLPQVAEETGWTKEEFLSALCSHKAGLPP
ncbi:AmmeMemoRadiSam system protein B, partial [bacterium]|nr:AmmeMemoRadiSam system protein B [bacterium]